jgi:hypothetical protein
MKNFIKAYRQDLYRLKIVIICLAILAIGLSFIFPATYVFAFCVGYLITDPINFYISDYRHQPKH